MERRVAGIIRWLERCVKAYKDGAVESALMDVECARIDMENLRGDLWKKLDGCTCSRKRGLSSLKIAEAFFCAFAVMMFAATPLASHQGRPAAESTKNLLNLEWVTPDEMELLSNIRKHPDESMAKATVQEVLPVKAAVPLSTIPAPARPRAPEPVRRRTPEPAPLPREQKKLETSLTYDSILSLIETGERAMKNDPPVIMMENAEGAAVDYE